MMEPICRDRIASGRLLTEFGLVSDGARRLFALKNCAAASDCSYRAACHRMLEKAWRMADGQQP